MRRFSKINAVPLALIVVFAGSTAARNCSRWSQDRSEAVPDRDATRATIIEDAAPAGPKIPGLPWKYRSVTGRIELIQASEGVVYVHDGVFLVGLNAGNGRPFSTVAAAGTANVLLQRASCEREKIPDVDCPPSVVQSIPEDHRILDIVESHDIITILSTPEEEPDWVWEDPFRYSTIPAGPVGDADRNRLAFIDAKAGISLGCFSVTDRSITSTGGLFFFCGTGGVLYAIDLRQLSAKSDNPPGISTGYALSAPSGSMTIRSVPEGAYITIDGMSWKNGPVEFEACAVGQYEIRAYLPGYETAIVQVTVSEGQRTDKEIILHQALQREWSFRPEGGGKLDGKPIKELFVVRSEMGLHVLTQDSGSLLWTLPVADPTHLYSYDRILSYASPYEVGVVALRTGKRLWSSTIRGPARWMALTGGMSLVVDGNNTLEARNVISGNLVWSVADLDSLSEPAMADNVIVCRKAGKPGVFAVNPATGESHCVIWNDSSIEMFTWRKPFILTYSDSDGILSAYHPDGTPAGREQRIYGSPTYDEEKIVYRRRWNTGTDAGMEIVSIIPREGLFFRPHVVQFRSPLCDNIDYCISMGLLFVSKDDEITAFNTSDGSQVWSREMNGSYQLLPFRDMVLAYRDEELRCIEPRTGETTITIDFKGRIDLVLKNDSGNRFFVFEGERIHSYRI